MEQVLFRVHVRVLSTSNRFLSPTVRKVLEYSVLLASIMTITTLVILHITYVMNSTNPGMNCILTALEQFDEQQFGINMVQRHTFNITDSVPHPPPISGIGTSLNNVSNTQSTTKRERLLQSWRENYDLIALKIVPAPGSENQKSLFEKLRQIRDWDSLVTTATTTAMPYVSTIAPNPKTVSEDGREKEVDEEKGKAEESVSQTYENSAGQCPTVEEGKKSHSSHHHHHHHGIDITSYQSTSHDYITRKAHTYLFAYTRGNLMLTQEPSLYSLSQQKQHSFSTLQLTFQNNHECFGPPSSNYLANLLTGYDIVVMNWAISAFGGIGYLYNLRSKELFNLNYASNFVAKKGVNLGDMGRQRRESYRTSSVVSEVLSLTKHSVVGPFLVLLHENFVGMVTLVKDHLPAMGGGRERGIGRESGSIGEREGQQVSHTEGEGERDRDSSNNNSNNKWLTLLKDINQFIAFRVGVLFSTTFIFFVSSSLVSYILRETQERMLKFTYLLQYHITRNLPYLPLIVTHVTESLVFVPIITGIYFFMFEFFSDQLLAFLVLLVVWMGEVFSILSLRSEVSIKYFPRIFCCYFYLFHVYFFSYPFGFCYLALLAATMLVFHSMMHFWNAYEIPAFYSGRLTALHPRMWTCPGVPNAAALVANANGAEGGGGVANANTNATGVGSTTASTTVTPNRVRSRANSANTGGINVTAATAITASPGVAAVRRGSGSSTTGSTTTGSGRMTNIPGPLDLSSLASVVAPVVASSSSTTTTSVASSPATPGGGGAHTPRSLMLLERMNTSDSSANRGRANSLTSSGVPSVVPPSPALAFSSIYETVEARRARLAAATSNAVANANANKHSLAAATAASGPPSIHAPSVAAAAVPPPPPPPPLSLDTPTSSSASLKYNRNRSSSEGTASTWQEYIKATRDSQTRSSLGGGSQGEEGEGVGDDDYGFFMEGDSSPVSPMMMTSKSGKHVIKNPPSWDQWGQTAATGSSKVSTNTTANNTANNGNRGMVQAPSETFNIFGVNQDD